MPCEMPTSEWPSFTWSGSTPRRRKGSFARGGCLVGTVRTWPTSEEGKIRQQQTAEAMSTEARTAEIDKGGRFSTAASVQYGDPVKQPGLAPGRYVASPSRGSPNDVLTER